MDYKLNIVIADAKRVLEDGKLCDRANDLIGVMCHTPKPERWQVASQALSDLTKLQRRSLSTAAAALSIDLANDFKELAKHL